MRKFLEVPFPLGFFTFKEPNNLNYVLSDFNARHNGDPHPACCTGAPVDPYSLYNFFFEKEKKILKAKDIWTGLVFRYVPDKHLAGNLWEEISSAYGLKERYYHNLVHIEYLIDHAFSYRADLDDFDTVLFSIFYHDIVYDPKRDDNEERSAQLARQRLGSIHLQKEKIIRCEQQILATKDHLGIGEKDCDYFLDFDLAILGEEPQRFRSHSENIRKEYSHLNDAVFARSRKQVLEGFLAMDRIYKTTPFYEKYEARARRNIKAEILS